MAVLIKTIGDGSTIEFDKGSFDEWCVFLTPKGQSRFAPKDILYFKELNQLGKKYGYKKIYHDFVKIYQYTHSKINPKLLDGITNIAHNYGEDQVIMDIWFTVIYAGMVAEENKQHAVLKKRVKRLGMYQLLIENKPPEYAASFSKGKKWRDLDQLMKNYGF